MTTTTTTVQNARAAVDAALQIAQAAKAATMAIYTSQDGQMYGQYSEERSAWAEAEGELLARCTELVETLLQERNDRWHLIIEPHTVDEVLELRGPSGQIHTVWAEYFQSPKTADVPNDGRDYMSGYFDAAALAGWLIAADGQPEPIRYARTIAGVSAIRTIEAE